MVNNERAFHYTPYIMARTNIFNPLAHTSSVVHFAARTFYSCPLPGLSTVKFQPYMREFKVESPPKMDSEYCTVEVDVKSDFKVEG